MKATLAAISLTLLAAAAPLSAARAGDVTIRVDTPDFGFRIGTPVRIYAPAPVYVPPPVYVPAPVYAPPAPVVYVPPRVVVRPPVVHRVYEPYPYRHARWHWKHKRWDRDDRHFRRHYD